jgi:alkylated DNA repair dioxygenase AlkB
VVAKALQLSQLQKSAGPKKAAAQSPKLRDNLYIAKAARQTTMSTALDFGAALAAAKREARKQRAANPPPPPTAAVAVPPPLPAAPPTIRYAAEFVDEREARALATALRRLDGWAQLPRRRLLSVGGTPHPDGAWTEPLPPCLRALARRAAAFFPDGRLPDQALVNEYVEGSGIAAHADGPLYEPCAVIVSLESSARLDFFTDGDERVASVLLRPRSVVAFADAAYLSLKHGIAAARADTVDDRVCNGAAAGCAVGDVVARAPSRLSVTFRRLKRVARRLDGVDASLLHDEDRVELERRRRWWAKSIADDALPSPPASPRGE